MWKECKIPKILFSKFRALFVSSCGKKQWVEKSFGQFPSKQTVQETDTKGRKKPLKIVLMAKEWTKVVVMGSSTCTTEALFTSFYKVRRSLE